ncbi:MAG: anhydro-N-acetylmuramic acid kinase [Chloroflexi bacterium]|nr:anhydro-N-acetylmuramic acid kinase [Chloroflexota bacterium]
MLIVGLMSGTSADGIDAAVIDLDHLQVGARFRIRGTAFLPYPSDLRAEILACCSPPSGTVDRICRLNALLGEWFARAALEVIERAGLRPDDVALIASHGQTVYHAVGPGADPPATLQIGEPAVIAERTGRTVVANFRPRDIAAGGQGAPLLSYVDYLLFAAPGRARALQNLGGVANVTLIPPSADASDVIAFDTGPGNMVIDGLMERLFGQPFDAQGAVAARGRVSDDLLADLLADPFFTRRPPRTTGREEFGAAYVSRLIERGRERGLDPADLVATATALTVRSIGEAYRRFLPSVDEVIVSGGGASNPTLLAWLRRELAPAEVRRSDEVGIPSDYKEAIGFAVLGFETIHGRASTLPRCTGARHAVVTGQIIPGDNYHELLRQISATPMFSIVGHAHQLERTVELMNQAVAEGVFPGAALVVGRGDETLLARGFGRLTTEPDAPAASIDTIYDLASLTKVIATTTAAMILVDEGRLDLAAPVATYLPDFAQAGKDDVRIRDLLLHCSGLPAIFPGGFPAYATAHRLPRDRAAIIAEVCAQPLTYPTGSRVVYSDLGFIALGAVIEAICGERLDTFTARRVFEPLEMAATCFNPPPFLWPRIAPTEFDNWRGGRIIRGEVHDECAWMMGGVAPHAGLFSTGRDLARFARLLLHEGTLGSVRIIQPETVAMFVRREGSIPGSTRALGWDTASAENAAGPALSGAAFGHTGFTGTSLWIDPQRALWVILLSNRVYPSRANQAIISFRPRLHAAVIADLER